jgi:hypothetical protein
MRGGRILTTKKKEIKKKRYGASIVLITVSCF